MDVFLKQLQWIISLVTIRRHQALGEENDDTIIPRLSPQEQITEPKQQHHLDENTSYPQSSSRRCPRIEIRPATPVQSEVDARNCSSRFLGSGEYIIPTAKLCKGFLPPPASPQPSDTVSDTGSSTPPREPEPESDPDTVPDSSSHNLPPPPIISYVSSSRRLEPLEDFVRCIIAAKAPGEPSSNDLSRPMLDKGGHHTKCADCGAAVPFCCSFCEHGMPHVVPPDVEVAGIVNGVLREYLRELEFGSVDRISVQQDCVAEQQQDQALGNESEKEDGRNFTYSEQQLGEEVGCVKKAQEISEYYDSDKQQPSNEECYDGIELNCDDNEYEVGYCSTNEQQSVDRNYYDETRLEEYVMRAASFFWGEEDDEEEEEEVQADEAETEQED